MADSRTQHTAFIGQEAPASVLVAVLVRAAAGSPQQDHDDAERASWPAP